MSSCGNFAAFVRTKVAQILVVGALVCAIGGHWATLQSLAWVGMFLKYSQSDSLKPALIKTFDGQHPCKLCRLIETGKKSEKKEAAQKPVPKLDLIGWSGTQRAAALTFPPVFRHALGVTSAPANGPPKPPPRQIPG